MTNNVFKSGSIPKFLYNDGTNVMIPKNNICDTINSTVYHTLNGIIVNSNNVEFSTGRGIGIFVSTENVKEFVLRSDTDEGYSGRLRVQCFDNSGTILTSSDANHPYVKSNISITWYTTFGGCYTSSADITNNAYFKVHSDVKYIKVFLTGGTANLKIRSYSIDCSPGKNADTWTGYNEIIAGAMIAASAPSTGTFLANTIIMNSEPAAGEAVGWMCTSGGSPGTWQNMGVLGLIKQTLEGSKTYDPPNLTPGANTYTTVTVTGASLGDYVQASFSIDLQGICVCAHVESTNTVSVHFSNNTGSSIDLSSGTLKVLVTKQ